MHLDEIEKKTPETDALCKLLLHCDDSSVRFVCISGQTDGSL